MVRLLVWAADTGFAPWSGSTTTCMVHVIGSTVVWCASRCGQQNMSKTGNHHVCKVTKVRLRGGTTEMQRSFSDALLGSTR